MEIYVVTYNERDDSCHKIVCKDAMSALIAEKWLKNSNCFNIVIEQGLVFDFRDHLSGSRI